MQDTPPRKYLVALTVGYSEKANVNATVQKVLYVLVPPILLLLLLLTISI
jgi:thiosulfate reductase cytochrome b subunit